MDHAAATPPPDAQTAPDLRTLADAVFEEVSPYPGFGFRNHCMRLWRFASMLMKQRGLSMDADLAYLVAMVHDLGIVSPVDEGPNYLRRSKALFHRITKDLHLADRDLGVDSLDVVDECLVYNHRLLPVPGVAPQAECFRRAVIVEHTHGLKGWGLDRAEVRAVFDELPRGNFDRVLLDFTWRTLRREPSTLVRGIFF